MERKKRVYVSVPRDHHLNDSQKALKHSIYALMERNGLEPQEFHVSGLPLRYPYTFDAVRDIMSRCQGVLILAFARWRDPAGIVGLALPTVWNHFEGAFAVALKKEILVITEKDVAEDGITWSGGGQLILAAPPSADPSWLNTPYAQPQIDAWVRVIKDTDDIFLRLQQQGTRDRERYT
jgi:hypothetical protein